MKVNVKDGPYLATGDGVTDDRVAIQNAINAVSAGGGGVVEIPAGMYNLTQTPYNYFCLEVPQGITLEGEGTGVTILGMAASTPASVRLVHTKGSYVRIRDLALYGQKWAQSASEHRHGLFAENSPSLIVERVEATGFTGDGFYLYLGCEGVTFNMCAATDNNRNGLTMAQQAKNVLVLGGKYAGNRVQQIDSEPVAGAKVTDIRVIGAYIEAPMGSIALTVSGSTAGTHSKNWSVVGNTIHGTIHSPYCNQVAIVGNHGTNTSDMPWYRVWQGGDHHAVIGNAIECTNSSGGIMAYGSDGAGKQPSHLVVMGNAVKMGAPGAVGIGALGASSMSILGNTLEGAGSASPYGAGVYVRPTNLTVKQRSSIVLGNYICDFGKFGALYNGSGTARSLANLQVGNVFDSVKGSQTVGVGLSLAVAAQTLECGVILLGNDAVGCTTTDMDTPQTPSITWK